MAGRLSGPMSLRLFLQPTMALIFAIRDGVRDAREGNPAYFWTLLKNSEHRRDMVRDGWKAIAKVFIMATILDCVYQFIVFRWIYPVEALLVAIILAILPYLFARGLVNRIARHWINKSSR